MKSTNRMGLISAITHLLAAAFGAASLNLMVPRTTHITFEGGESMTVGLANEALPEPEDKTIHADFPLAKTPGEMVWYMVLGRPFPEAKKDVMVVRDLVTNKVLYVMDRFFTKNDLNPRDALNPFDFVGVYHIKPSESIPQEGHTFTTFKYQSAHEDYINFIRAIGSPEFPLTKETERIEAKPLY